VDKVASKVASLLRLLASANDGECLGAARGIGRLLKSAGLDFHALAQRIEQPVEFSKTEMQKLYAAGYECGFAEGMRTAELAHFGNGDFRNVDGEPEWLEISRWCQRQSSKLSLREQQFVNDVTARCVWREPRPKQEKWLRSIFFRLG
jgi:hypothetical protein